MNAPDALRRLEESYVERTPRSREAISRAAEVLPGGNTRSVLHFDPYPPVFDRAEGSVITDIDGNRSVDFLNDFSAGLYGHSHPVLLAAMHAAIERGVTWGGVNRDEQALARALVERFPALQQVRFTTSGTEAVLMAVNTARAATGRDRILVMRGGYHGSALNLSPTATRTNAPYDLVHCEFNETESVESAVAQSGDALAAVLVEPMMGAAGCIPAERRFLQRLRELADERGTLLIFDEVMTSRLGPHGAHGELGITPDLMTFGKYLGGGGTFGGFGGRAELMTMYDARRPGSAMHGGTFNNNPITMAAGLAGLLHVYTPSVAAEFLQRGERFRESLCAIVREQRVAVQVTGWGSLLNVHFLEAPIRTARQAAGVNPELRGIFHLAMLERGVHLARRGYVSLSLANSEDDLRAFLAAFSDVLERYGAIFNGTRV